MADPRFFGNGLHSSLDLQSQKVADAVRGLNPDAVLSTSVGDIADRFYERFKVNPIVLHLDRQTSSGAKDRPIQIHGHSGRLITVDGTRVEVLIPFEGDELLFDCQATTSNLNPPRFDVRAGSTVAVAFEGRSPLDKEEAKNHINRTIADIQKHLVWQRQDIDPWNRDLRAGLSQQIEARRQKVLADRELDDFLDVPVIGRTNPAPSFVVDPARRPKPKITSAPSAPGFTPEPAISDQGFADILDEITSVTTAVERLPRTFASMPEESLRDVLLVVLNNRFGQATGETFSRNGKTDIFISHEDGAVFIAECKIWKGSKGFGEAIDQLLGYLTWRDTKAALIVFLKKGQPTEIREKAAAELEKHASYKRHEDGVFTLANPTDTNREIHVALRIIPVLLGDRVERQA